jgi:Redoxin
VLTFTATYIALWCLVVFQGLVVLALLRQLAELRISSRSKLLSAKVPLPEGAAAPNFVGADVLHADQEITLSELSRRGGVVLFLTTDCQTCITFAKTLRAAGDVSLSSVILFCLGATAACSELLAGAKLPIQLVTEGAADIASSYGVSRFPTAVVIDGNLRVVSYSHPEDAAAIEKLFRNADSTNSQVPVSLSHNVSSALGGR